MDRRSPLVNNLRHADMYLSRLREREQQLQESGSMIVSALLALNLDWAQIDHAYCWVSAHADDNSDAAALSIDYARYGGRYLGNQGQMVQRVNWGIRALELAERTGDNLAIAELCGSIIAWPLLQLGRHAEAKHYSEKGMEAARSCNAYRWAGEAARTLSGLARDRGLGEEAEYWAEEALKYAEQSGHKLLKRGAMMDLGYAALLKGNYTKTEELFRELLQAYILDDDRERIANFYGALAIVALNLDRIDEAEELYAKSYQLARELGSEIILAETEFGFAKVAEARAMIFRHRAREFQSRARKRFEKLGIQRPGRAEQYVTLTKIRHRFDTKTDVES